MPEIMNPQSTARLQGPKPGRFWLIVSLIALILLGPTKLQAARSHFDVDARPGVSPAQIKSLSLAINDVFKFFMSNYNIALHKRMLLIVAPDDGVYADVLAKDIKMPKARAQKMSKLSGGVATETKDRYILAVKAKASEPMASIMESTCHEMVHWYQYREATRQQCSQHGWLLEGVANVIAYNIVETHLPGQVDRYRQYYLSTLKKASQVPAFVGLETGNAWEAAMEKYGGSVLYGKATLAVMELSQRTGLKSLFAYFRHLKAPDS